MFSYILRRVFATIPVMLIVALFVFSLLYIAPGDPAAVIAGDQASPEDVEKIRKNLGLDRPFLIRFSEWFFNLFLFGKIVFRFKKLISEIILFSNFLFIFLFLKK
ncbi:MAG: hypothetical protein WCJ34_14100 [Alcaligenaceae bacterium]